MGQAHILQFESIPPADWGGGIITRKLVAASLGATGFCNGITTFPPGGALRMHTHNVDESVTILEGEAVVDVGKESRPVKPYDTSFVPAGIPHRFRNAGPGAMSILWVYTGTHVTRTFVDTGETWDE